MEALDDFVSHARSENAAHHERHADSMQTLSGTVEQSFGSISSHFKATFDRVQALGDEMEIETGAIQNNLGPLHRNVRQPLTELREDVASNMLREYQPTGETPERVQYAYPTELPRTDAHEILLATIRDEPTPTKAEPVVFADLDHPNLMRSPPRMSMASIFSDKNVLSKSLREVNPNLTANLTTSSLMFDPSASIMSNSNDNTVPLFRRSTRSKAPKGLKKQGSVVALDGRENVPPSLFSQSASKRKSPRLN
jgi:kinesin family member 11